MAKISKQLGIKSDEIGDRLLELLRRIESSRPKKPSTSSSVSSTSPSEKCEREPKLLEFGMGFQRGAHNGGRDKGRRALITEQ